MNIRDISLIYAVCVWICILGRDKYRSIYKREQVDVNQDADNGNGGFRRFYTGNIRH